VFKSFCRKIYSNWIALSK